MCGIAGFALSDADMATHVDQRKLASVLGLSIENRGKDATGVSLVCNGNVQTDKRPVNASKFFGRRSQIDYPSATMALVHTRAATQGSPDNALNNHPILSGNIVGIHNGVIYNDDELFKDYGLSRRAKVDSEAAFALIDHFSEVSVTTALEALEGWMALAWIDKRNPDSIHLVRGESSPLVTAVTPQRSLVFGSTIEAVTRGVIELCGEFPESVECTSWKEGQYGVFDRHTAEWAVETFKPAVSSWSGYNSSLWATTQGESHYDNWERFSPHPTTARSTTRCEDRSFQIGDRVENRWTGHAGTVQWIGEDTISGEVSYGVEWDVTEEDSEDLVPEHSMSYSTGS